jgi:hypothetical protein
VCPGGVVAAEPTQNYRTGWGLLSGHQRGPQLGHWHALASMTGRKAVERKRFGNHYKAYEFEYQAVTDARGQDGRGRTLVT